MFEDDWEQLVSYLARLEAESMHIIREAVAPAENPVMLSSIGTASTVMLHLARKVPRRGGRRSGPEIDCAR